MIKAINLSKRFGEVEAVSQINLSIPEGKIVGLLGPNGAGKTTTMRMLAGCLRPSAGDIELKGNKISPTSPEFRNNLGYLPETPPLYPDLTVAEYLRFVARVRGIAGKELGERVEQVVELCFLSDVTSRLCGQLSKGYKQRVGLAQAIIHKPEFLILDEPTSGLDPAQIVDIRKLISSLASFSTVLLSSHILPEVSATCSELIIINKGQVISSGSLENYKDLEKDYLEIVSGGSATLGLEPAIEAPSAGEVSP